MKYRLYFQKGWLNEGDRRFGFIIERRDRERFPTFDVCWWWGWVLIYVARREGK